ncbi:N-acetylglucosaminidase [Hornefia butyriciproducens]|uniref:N-acetylglucosaminidase n=1 Tax=Hornefia butyriciproducens TaxID=2652293 RepID=UPI0023F0A191|nr:hypothetical protein [Hornefia butyriciproducens]MDD6299283.1 hypothetical protein [Hornefia butyriciproducens]
MIISVKKNNRVRMISVTLFGIILAMMMCGTDVFAASKPVASGTAKTASVIRASASVSSAQVKSLSKGKKFSIKAEYFTAKKSMKAKYKWYYISSYKGYIRSDLVKYADSVTVSGKTTAAVNIRTGAGWSYAKKAVYKKGKSVKVVLTAYDRNGEKWYKIKVGSKYYYVIARYVKLSSTSSTASSSKSTSSSSSSKSSSSSSSTSTTSFKGFPSSYTKKLAALKKAHPKWEFVAVNTGLDWSDAVSRMTAKTGTNLVYTTFPYSYRSVEKGCYNYLTNRYAPKDGAKFIAASEGCVKFYMDPRNWLDDTHVFMFEDNRYHSSYQTLSMVETMTKGRNNLLHKNSTSFIKAAKNYNISPVYLTAKALEEQGSKINSGKVGTRTVYNVFNIGAYDSASGGASNGIRYAGSGSSYLRPWTSIDKAIRGGAKYIASNFIANNQSCAYLEHFNVMNGLSKVGTHVYMTAVYAPRNTSVSTASSYKRYKIYDKKIVFYIPVYKNMPASACKVPSSSWKKDNNYYLKTLKVTAGGRTYTKISSSSQSYTKSFTVYVGKSVSSATISAGAASRTSAKVSGTGKKSLSQGTNTFKVVCTASSGLKRTYTVKVVRGS